MCVNASFSKIAKEMWVHSLLLKTNFKNYMRTYVRIPTTPPPTSTPNILHFNIQFLCDNIFFSLLSVLVTDEEAGGLDPNVDVERRNENTRVQLFGRPCPRRHVCLHLFYLPRRRSFRKENGAGCVFDSALVRLDPFALTCSNQRC
jgi:hypothetical protein